MYNSTPLNPRAESNKINFSLNATSNDVLRSFGGNKLTSTPYPKRENAATTPTRTNPGLSRRYSLSDVNLTPSNFLKDSPRSKNPSARSSPVVANGRYNVNVSTYLDSRSPGYAGRMVRYSEEKEKSLPTHHPKYNVPGLFPIVHLFKKDLPVLKRKPSKVTVRIASPELSRFNTPEQNRMLLERIINSNATKKTTPQMNEVNTKSVLDALKEISRKRIHSNEEEYEVKDDGKRIRMDCFEGMDPKKRTRDDDSPKAENSTSPRGSTKKLCYIDEIIASHSSMDGHKFEESPKVGVGGKIITGLNQSINKKKEVRETTLVDVETQTVLAEPDPVPAEKSEPKKVIAENTEADKYPAKSKKPSPVKVFDEKPLEMMRKNRLSALMGSLIDHKTIQSRASEIQRDTENENPGLISILSTSPKQHKNEKHVTFNLTENVSTVTPTLTNAASSLVPSELNTSPKVNPSVTQTSTSIITPIVSSSVTESPISSRSMDEKSKLQASSPSNLVKFSMPTTLQATSNQPVASPSFSFSLVKSPTTQAVFSTPSITTMQSGIASTTSASPITFNFGNTVTSAQSPSSSQQQIPFSFGPKPTTSTPAPNINATVTSSVSPPKPAGGFKFDLNNPTANLTSSPSFVIAKSTTPTTTTNQVKPATTFMFAVSKPESSSTLSTSSSPFLPKFSVVSTGPSNTPSGLMFPSKSTTSSLSVAPTVSSSGGFSFSSVPSVSFEIPTKPSTASSVINPTISSNNSSVPTFSFMASTATPTPATFNFNTSSKPTFGIVTTISASNTSGFRVAVSNAPSFVGSTSAPFSLNTASTSTPIVGAKATAPATTTVTPFVGLNSTNKTPVFTFGGNNTKTETTSSNNVFGNTDKPVFTGIATTSSNNVFGNTDKPVFTGITTTSSFFGPTNSSLKTVPANPNFGVQTTQSLTAPISTPFNASKTNFVPTTNAFGNMFTANTKATTASNVFGTNAATTSAASIFGSTNPAVSASNNVFGSNNIGSTATNNATGFGATSSSGFTGSNNMFGGNNLQTPGFGAATNTNAAKPIFGSTQAPINFGAVTTTTTQAGFGTTTASSVFGNTSGFGTTTAAPAFGTNTAPSFGSNTFGANQFANNNNSSSTIQTTTAAPSFGGSSATFANTTVNGFGAGTSNTPAFGGSQTSTPAPPAFGATTNTNFNPQSNAFGSGSGFGGSSSAFGKPPETAGGFSSSTNAFVAKPTNFGATNLSTKTPATTQSGVFTFGSNNTSKPAVFSFGASEPPKPAFNFTAGTSNSPAPAFGGNTNFGSTAAPPAFGAIPAPQFNPPGTPGMFSIGSGSSTPNRSSRTQLKAKRRT